MPEVQKYSLVEELRRADEIYKDSLALVGMTSLTFSDYINSMRSNMFTSHLKQYLNLEKPEFPFLFTGVENLVGKYSFAYNKTKHDIQVVKKIEKFKDIMDHPHIYKLFILDLKKDKYDVIDRVPIGDLTENFGFEYDNTVIDTLEEGQTVPKDTVLYHSTSYDEDMNYAYGKNVRVMYTLDPYTTEDAAVVSKSLAKEMTSIETEHIRVGLNDNDFLINLYGLRGDITEDNEEEYYKPLPDIGSYVSGILLATRRQFNNQLLFDFKRDSLNEIHEGDDCYYVGLNNQIIDYTIYNNNEEVKNTAFMRQVNKLIEAQNLYYQEIYETCDWIMHKSGKGYSREIEYLYKRSNEMLDKKKKWKDGDSAFSNMVIDITTRKVVPLSKGQKITGRYGNKSVISEIRNDEDMPFTEDGERVDLLLNLLAIINRTTSMPLFELAITSISRQVRKKMASLSTDKEKLALLFDFLESFNPTEAENFMSEYKSLGSKKEKKQWIEDAINEGIYLHQPPIHENVAIFHRIRNILDKFDFIKPDKVFIRQWGRVIPVLNDNWIGHMYILEHLRHMVVISYENFVNCWDVLLG